MDAMLVMLNSLSHRDRLWLVKQISEQVQREEAESNRDWQNLMQQAPSWEEEDNARLDAALARLSGDWGGDGTPSEIADKLRQGAMTSRNVETW